MEPATAADSFNVSYRPFHGLQNTFFPDPGACAPGFMPSPASQALCLTLNWILNVIDSDFLCKAMKGPVRIKGLNESTLPAKRDAASDER